MRSSRHVPMLLVLLLAAGTALAAGDLGPRPFPPAQEGFTSQAQQVLPYAPDRLLVQFTPRAMAALDVGQDKGARLAGSVTGFARVDALTKGAGVYAIERPYRPGADKARAEAFGKDRWFMFRFEAGADLPALAEALRRDANVDAVSLDWVAFPAVVPGDDYYLDHWGHNNTAQLPDLDWGGTYDHTLSTTVGTPGFDANAEAAWDGSQGFGSSSIVIAILDSGVDIDHPDLRLISGYDFGDNDSNPDDNSAQAGHGTCCAGVAAAVNNGFGAVGIAAGCSIMPCKVADSGGSMYFSYIQDALYWAADNGADVISMSLGAAITSDPATDAALAYAHNAGCVVLAATGNENASTISYPAIHADVIGVGAASPCGERKRSSSSRLEVNPGVNTDPNGYTCDGERWWGSNYGVTTVDAAGAVDVIAPTILPTTDIGGSGGYRSGDYEPFFNGTSCATPYAAGVAALIKSANPTWTNNQIRDQLVNTAQDVTSVESGAGWDRYAGYGMVDAAAAVGGGGPVAPVANFTGTPTSGDYPLVVAFTDGSSGAPTGWSWTFGDGGTSIQQNPTYTYTAPGTYTVSLTVTNDFGSDSLTRTGYVNVTEPGVTTFVTASGETPISGTVSGTFAATAVSDGVSQSITEIQYTGHPVKTYSYLEHRWNFDLPAGGAATFHLEAARSNNAESDDMVFEYSTDGVNWLGLATVTSAAEQTFAVSLGNLSGAVTVRAYDSDHSWGNTALDVLSVDYLAFELGDVQPVAPTAEFAGTPTSGEYPLAVQFTDLSSGDPTGWIWTFGDGGTSTARNPSHTYNLAGTYSVSLTASNAQGSDTVTKTGYITVNEPGVGGTTMHVAAMAVNRVRSGPNSLGSCAVVIVDDQGQPVGGASVSAVFDGPTSGSTGGTTAADGTVTLSSTGIKKPSGEWCFEITNVTHATLGYDPGSNVTTRSCESGDVFNAEGGRIPAEFGLAQNSPNPFNPMTVIRFNLPRDTQVALRVYNVRGQVVETLVERTLGAGEHQVTWDAKDSPSGVYFYRIETPGFSETRKMIMLK
ncbi:MAG: S8 family serine peptidase [Candidatus Krumholzibacteriia bacterium]